MELIFRRSAALLFLLLFSCFLADSLQAQDRDLRAERIVVDDDAADGTMHTITIQAPNPLLQDVILTIPDPGSATGSLILSTGGGFWDLGGNSGTTPLIGGVGSDYVGTSDLTALSLLVNAGTSNGLILNTNGSVERSDAAGATAGNARGTDAIELQRNRSAATQVASGNNSVISGGTTNQASGNFSTVGGGGFNVAIGTSATVSGGAANSAGADFATAGGGSTNLANGYASVVGGGGNNQATAPYATIGGGGDNWVAGNFSSVPGGFGLTLDAAADGSFGFLGGNTGVNDMTISAPNTATFGNTDLWLANNDNAASQLRFYEAYNTAGAFPSTANYTAFVAGTQTADILYTLPTAAPTVSGQVLASTTAGVMSWVSAGGGSSWGLTGNAGTTAGTNFVGTTDATALHLAVNSGTDNSLILNTNGSVQRDAAGNARGTDAVDLQRVRTLAPQVASGSHATIGGGQDNIASGNSSTVGGGIGNTASGAVATIAGGRVNTATFDYSSVGGGLQNSAAAYSASVGAGSLNTASGVYASVSGGLSNTASGDFATVGAGRLNTASGDSAFVGGGASNVASGRSSFVGGGLHDTASGGWAVVGGGSGNTASGHWAVVGGGERNTASVDFAVVAGGARNSASGGRYNSIGGGAINVASDDYAAVGGGLQNTASGPRASIGGGSNNIASSDNAVVAGGNGNTASGGSYTSVVGGNVNTASGSYAFVGGGEFNIASADYSTIPGGHGLTLDVNADGSFGFLGGNTGPNAGTNNMTISAPDIALFGNTDLWLANNDNAASQLRFYEAYNTAGAFPSSANYTALVAGTQTADIVYTLPTAAPTSGVGNLGNGSLESTSGGTMSWRGTATATANLNFPATANGGASDLTITVTGAALGDLVTLGVPNASVPGGASINVHYSAWVSAANTITVRFHNNSAIARNPAAGTFAVKVERP